MNATGKRARKATGMNRFGIHFANHTHKSDRKRRASGWTKSVQERKR